MTRDEFYSMLEQGDVEVTFIKKTDGSTRVMKCSANAPENEKKEHDPKKATRPETLITTYDTEAKGMRSFYADNIIEVKPLDSRFGLLQE